MEYISWLKEWWWIEDLTFEEDEGEICFEILAIWIIEENPPKTKIWANNSPGINPIKFEQVKEVGVTEITWQLGFDDDDENISSIFLFFFFEIGKGIIDNWI